MKKQGKLGNFSVPCFIFGPPSAWKVAQVKTVNGAKKDASSGEEEDRFVW